MGGFSRSQLISPGFSSEPKAQSDKPCPPTNGPWRARSPNREFRPTFERLFGERMAAFPAPLPPEEYEGPVYPYGVPEPDGGDAIPF